MNQPKVRFSQASDSCVPHAGDEGTVPNKSKGKVKIKSIVPTAYPVKVLKNGQRVLLIDQKGNLEANKKGSSSSSVSGCSKFGSSTSSIPAIYVSEVHNSPSKNEYENVNKNVASDNQNIRSEDKNLEECIDKLQHFSLNNSQNCAQHTDRIREQEQECEALQSSKNESFKSCLDYDDDSDIEVIQLIEKPTSLKSIKTNKTCTDNRKGTLKKENKENKLMKSNTSNNQQNVKKTKILKDTINPLSAKNKNVPPKKDTINPLSVNNKNVPPKKDTINPLSVNNKNVPPKKFTKSPYKIQLMPCAKFRDTSVSKTKPARKEKKAETRKSIVYHTTSSHTNVSVGPGTFHKKCSHPADKGTEKSDEEKNIASENLLSCPEYNSTVCVMKNFKKLENEKLIPDFQHLPQEYKNLIYGKVSAGLDIAPYECVYKDLINISVDDNKLPARLMRSKDPEPRDKDIAPQISDFYQPKYAEQYFSIANPVVPRPVNLNTLSAFTISNKICAWKNARDNF